MNAQELRQKQHDWFSQGVTHEISFRLGALELLQSWIREHTGEIEAALQSDLGKAPQESYSTEIGMVLEELRFTLRHLKGWAKPKKRWGPLSQFPSRLMQISQPRGSVLIISPWNYPFQLAVIPLVGAIAAGNTAVIRPSRQAPATAALVKAMISELFEPEFIHVVLCDTAEAETFTKAGFDLIFFTGSPAVGRHVMACAAETLTPVILELGGKSPCIVDSTADLKLAAKRIVWGKLLNAGQTCVAPDYILADNRIKGPLMAELQKAILSLYGENPSASPDYPHIISEKAYGRLKSLLAGEDIFWQGDSCDEKRILGPVILQNVTMDSPVMQEEIFGPILPVIGFDTIGEAKALMEQHPHPLALYLFSNDKAVRREILRDCSFGGGCINDTIVHLATTKLPFGGVGTSGMGSYHGKASFDAFSHRKTVLKKANWLDLPLRYPPYNDKNDKLIRKVLK